MTLLRFTAPDGTAVGIDHTTITGARTVAGNTCITISSEGAFITVTETTAAVIETADAAKLRDRQAAEWDRKAELDLLDKRIELERMRIANTNTPGLSWGEPRQAFTRQDIEPK